MLKYEGRITAVGPLAGEFVDAGILVFFGLSAPEELAEFAILHDGAQLHAAVTAGDRIRLDGHTYRVLAVGDIANGNLERLGHLVVKFNGQTEPEMPGDVCVEAKVLPPIGVGMRFAIESGD